MSCDHCKQTQEPKLSSPLAACSLSTSNSSSTLISEKQLKQQQQPQSRKESSLTANENRSRASNRLSLPVEFVESTKKTLARIQGAHQGHPSSNSSIATSSSSSSSTSTSTSTSTMNSRSSLATTNDHRHHQQHLWPPPQPATSDYWSSAVTTSASSEFAALANLDHHHHRQQQQQQLITMMQQNDLQQQQQDAAAAERNNLKVPNLKSLPDQTPLTMTDQDYYLDVAAASLHQQQQARLELGPSFQMMINPHQEVPRVMFGGMHPHQQSPSDQMQLDTMAVPDDYDDYAVPSDENCCRLDRSQVELVQLIGEGQKGYVFLGKLQSRDGLATIDVAIKTLKFETEQLIERLMNEAAMMKQLEHPHIIRFIGMCPETPALIAMELAHFGELKHYLKINRNLIKCSQLVLFAFQISTALSYLESKNYVHRDVAARNVLVCSHTCVKLADFGLSRNLQPSFLFNNSNNVNYAAQQQAACDRQPQSLYVAAPRVKLPVRWLAPESLVFRRFTSASDVWMFAVCTWELFQFGQLRPWPQLRNNQVLAAIESGQRLSKPEACPQRLHQLMLKCWSYAPVQRPKFREIKQCIWSIYLNERTREQLDLERYERERHRHLLLSRQQQQQHHLQQVPLLTSGLHQQQQQQQQQQHLTKLISASPNSMLANSNSNNNTNQLMQAQSYAPTSSYSSTVTTTDDNEQSTSPCSSAFNSMGRASDAAAHRRANPSSTERATPNANCEPTALRSQLSRFTQRQSTPNTNNSHHQTRPHVLQKQRSQGAIGLTRSERSTDEEEAPALKSTSKQQRRANQGPTTKQPFDDEALEHVKRRHRQQQQQLQRAGQLTQAYLYPSRLESDDDDDDDDDDLTSSPTLQDGHTGPMQYGARTKSVSPALTADAGSQSRLISVEPAACEGLARPASRGVGQVAMLRANFDLMATGGLRSPNLPVVAPNATTSPALTSSNSSRPVSWRDSSPADGPMHQQQQQHDLGSSHFDQAQQEHQKASRAVREPEHSLGQMLQALRITPMKAKLRQPREQNARVLRREEKHSPPPSGDTEPAPQTETPPSRRFLARQTTVKDQSNGQEEDEQDEHTRQLLLHQRLLGRIRPSSSSISPFSSNQQQPSKSSPQRPENRALVGHQQVAATGKRKSDGTASSGQQKQPQPQQQQQQQPLRHQNKSVEAVDHSLQILESLLSDDANNETNNNHEPIRLARGQQHAASLTRRSHRKS